MKDLKEVFIKYSTQHKKVFIFSFVALFFTLFDSIMSYITPLLIQERGFSMSMIGLIIGTSSIVGALFDFIISKFFKKIEYKRIFMIMFAICAIYPFLLWQAKTLWFFIFVMGVWGVYFDLYGFGVFNFVEQYTKKQNYSSSFGIIQIFRSLGQILGPLIVGLVLIDVVDWKSFTLGWFFIGISFICFLFILFSVRKNSSKDAPIEYKRRKNFLIEFHLWGKIGKFMSPVLLITIFLFFVDGFFWTIGPLYVMSTHLEFLGGLFLTAYTLPSILTGLLIGYFVKRFSNKKVAFFGLLFGSFVLSLFYFSPTFITSIFIVFISSLFMSISLPAVNSVYAEYISETPQVENEIEGLEDFAFNIGYVLGPISAGVLAQIFGVTAAFSVLGVMGIVLAITLIIFSPKKGKLHFFKSEL